MKYKAAAAYQLVPRGVTEQCQQVLLNHTKWFLHRLVEASINLFRYA